MKQRKSNANARIRAIEQWQVIHACGHSTIHSQETNGTELLRLRLRLRDDICPDCKELEK